MNTLDTDHSTAIDPTTLSLSGTSSTITRVCSWAPTLDDPSRWVVGAGSAESGYFQTDAPTEQECWWPLHLPHGATLTAVRLVIQGGGAHIALPTPMPLIKVRSVTNGGTAASVVSPSADSSADVTAFELLHTIEVTGLSVVIDNTSKRYTLFFVAEGATDGTAGAKIFHPTYDFTMTNLDFE
jgi:hypothetical protein